MKEAKLWAIQTEANISETAVKQTTVLFLDISQQYITDILPLQKGFKQEHNRLNIILKELGKYSLGQLSPTILSSYRDRRLKTVSGTTVKKELSLISRIINVTIKEWGYHLPNGNPTSLIRFPPNNNARVRRLEQGELDQLLKSSNAAMTEIITILVETGMRRGELCKITKPDIDWKKRILTLLDTKNGTDRTIPLSYKAVESLKFLSNSSDTNFLINRHADYLSHQFLKACKSTNIIDLRLHDLRHEATSRLFEKGFNSMEVASITGHKTVAMLQRYTHLRPESLLDRLNNP